MSKYKAVITTNDNMFYALIVRADKDGQENVIHGYKGRSFKTRKGTEKSTAKYLKTI